MKVKMKKMKLLLLVGLLATASCTSYKQVPYLINSEEIDTTVVTELYDARIQPKDLLTITVSCENPETALPFNLTIPTTVTSSRTTYSQPVLQTYLVDNDGFIEFPSLGKVHIGGLTKTETETLIKSGLESHFREAAPIVSVRFTNYKISVIGEVVRPNTYVISNEKVNVFEALAMAGDLTIYGKRDGIKLIREETDGTKKIIPINLNDANIIYSPYYYLRQNDVLYVEPNKAKAQNSEVGSMTSLFFSATSILISVANLLFNILN